MSLLTPSLDVGERPVAQSVSTPFADTLVIATVAAALSMLFTGYVFGIENNLFHLPVVAGLYDEPQFRDDAFIQSLRHFASGVWLLLDNTQRYFPRTDLLFFGLDCLSRLLTFIGLLACASLLGIVTRRQKIVFALLATTTPFLIGFSPAGTGGLIVCYFTHSEVANGPLLLAIYFAARGRYTAAMLAWAVTFFVNVFMAVWLTPLLVIIGVMHLAKGEANFGRIFVRVALGLLISTPLLIPVLHAIFSNPEFGKSPGFDYIAYLHEYFPGHSLITGIATEDIIAMLAVMAIGAAALWRLGASVRVIQAVYAGALAMYLIGVVIPLVSGSPLILNIQLLRSGTVIHLLAGVAALALATNWLCHERSAYFLSGALIVLTLGFGTYAYVLAVPVMLLPTLLQSASDAAHASRRKLGYAVLALFVIGIVPQRLQQHYTFNGFYADGVAEWTKVARWARESTPENAIFIVPRKPDAASSPPVWDIGLSRAVNFEFLSHRRIWVDWRRGAAAMWTPSYYRIWHERMTALSATTDHTERLAYAARNGIGYVTEICDELPSQDGVLFRTTHLCVFAVPQQATAR